jgi:hypothetical protein
MILNKTRYFAGVGIVALSVAFFSHSFAGKQKPVVRTAENYSSSWQSVDSLINDGLTQAAIDTINIIFKGAKVSGNADQMIKALIKGFQLVNLKEEDAFIKNVTRINAELVDAKFPVAPVLHSMLAECYWHYYQDNRHRFYNRTQTQNFDLNDIHTWDLRTIMEQMTNEYELSLKDAERLKETPIDFYSEVINNQHRDVKLRPTLYDFLAHRAVDFFTMDDNELTKPAFEIKHSSEIYFAP